MSQESMSIVHSSQNVSYVLLTQVRTGNRGRPQGIRRLGADRAAGQQLMLRKKCRIASGSEDVPIEDQGEGSSGGVNTEVEHAPRYSTRSTRKKL